MPLINLMKNHDWGICTNCRFFQEMGEYSGCARSGDPFSKVPTCDLFEMAGPCDTCVYNRREFNARGCIVVECHRCGDGPEEIEFERKRSTCRGYRRADGKEE